MSAQVSTMGGLDVLVNNGAHFYNAHVIRQLVSAWLLSPSCCLDLLLSDQMCGTCEVPAVVCLLFWAALSVLPPVLQCGVLAAGACCSDLGVQHYGMADEIEFLENYKTHVASTVIMMQVQPHSGTSYCCTLSASNEYDVACVCIACMLPSG